MLSSLVLQAVLLSVPATAPDLNTATLEELHALPGLSGEQAEALYAFILETGGLRDVYDVMEIPGFTARELSWLKENTSVVPPPPSGISPAVLDVMERLAVEDGPGDAAVALWEDLLIRPMPANRLTSWDLRKLEGVSLVDAAAVEARLATLGPVSSVTSFRGADNLTYYGFRNMRDYIAVRELDLGSMEPFGSLRISVDAVSGRWYDEEGLEANIEELNSAISDFEEGGRDYTGSSVDSLALYRRLIDERDQLLDARHVIGSEEIARIGMGDRLRAGVRLSRGNFSTAGHGLFSDIDMGEAGETWDVAKGFASLQYLGPVRQVILGNYRLSLGQGLMVDNTDELMKRTLYRPWGLNPDLTSTRQFAFTGGAAEIRAGRFIGFGFFSSAPRDAILNSDGTPAALVLSRFRTSQQADAVRETTVGGYGIADLGGILPYGTAIGAGVMNISWSDSLSPNPAEIDIPGDAEPWLCPEFMDMPAGAGMRVFSLSGQTVLGPMSFEGEAAFQDDDGSAVLAGARWQNDWFYLLGAYRRYSMGFTNPYNRGFAEQGRFDDTIFDKPYYLNDPLMGQMADWPVPKPEEGLYVESRFQVSRQVIFPKVYLDVWRSIPWGFENYRFQGEIEYRPVFPVRFRLKYKLQDKTKMQDIIPTNSTTHEITLRTFILPPGNDFFEVSLRAGAVELTPNPRYSDDRLMTGGFVSARWEHRFTEGFSALGGTTLWTTSGMSQWEFEDTGIDFLDGRGSKIYLTIKQTVSDSLQLRLRILRKDTYFPRTGLYRPDPDDQYYYEGDGSSLVRDFGDHRAGYGIDCQLDFRW
ncbi:MAG: helix-hairpin-helix domain-containing protein [Candidatus Fermentibacter daniensis]|jgi:hypothetical protein|nr:helix-hairpin-helix domain-containing protein [Candidatus Fermentibacter daniensis]HQH92300.1 helix-hairpin-helix domain-containing protein [Candidatus Fermentibacter daniensis]